MKVEQETGFEIALKGYHWDRKCAYSFSDIREGRDYKHWETQTFLNSSLPSIETVNNNS